jgi:hypothetical protein
MEASKLFPSCCCSTDVDLVCLFVLFRVRQSSTAELKKTLQRGEEGAGMGMGGDGDGDLSDPESAEESPTLGGAQLVTKPTLPPPSPPFKSPLPFQGEPHIRKPYLLRASSIEASCEIY